MVTCVYDGNDTRKSLLGNLFQRHTGVVPTGQGLQLRPFICTVAAFVPGLSNVTNLEAFVQFVFFVHLYVGLGLNIDTHHCHMTTAMYSS